jgi:hypothetical protein
MSSEQAPVQKKITLCGDNCLACPRYLAKTEEGLRQVAELWQRAGWRDFPATPEEMRCGGCSSHKSCTYHLVECIRTHGVKKCSQCPAFPCDKISDMLERSRQSQLRCKKFCTEAEYAMLDLAFFHKEENLQKD